MISDPHGRDAIRNRGQFDETQRAKSGRPEILADTLQHSPFTKAITGPALLQTEQVLLRRAPEYVPIIQQIRHGGSIAVQSGDSSQEGTYNLYRVSTSPEGCKMIADALLRALDAQRGHPASLRVLVGIWQKLQQQMT